MSDVMSSLGLAIFPIIALVLFLSVFIGVVLQVTRRNRKSTLDNAAFLPLADEVASTRLASPQPAANAKEPTR
jgi:cbb3-type cytochrome oxidase subunit 3